MKTLVKIFAVAIMFTACNNKGGTLETLIHQRDSIQELNFENEKIIHDLNAQIIELDSTLNKDEQIIKKKIIKEKQTITNAQQTIAELENQILNTDSDLKNTPVSIKEMKKEEFAHYFLVYGNVEADKYGNISPEMSGRIESILVREGQVVKKGQLLLTLNTEAINKQIAGTKTTLEFATTSYNKQKALWDQEIGSEIQYLQAKSNKEGLEAQLEALESQKRMAQLRAPYTGTVNKIYPKVGELASPGFPVIEFVNLSKMTVRAQISERYISKVKKGQTVELSFASLANYKVNPKIVRVSKVINPKSRTFEIEIKIDNPNENIKPNMVSTIRINDYKNTDAFVIPSEIVRNDISNKYVYVVNEEDGKNIVSKKVIETDLSYKDKTEVVNGLEEGDKVIVSGFNLVSTGLPVDIK